jgi:tellurium resistance protein TerD
VAVPTRPEPVRAPEPPRVEKKVQKVTITKRGSRILQRSESVDLSVLGKDIENHDIFAGLYWQVNVAKGEVQGTDIDLSAVKFDRHGHSLGAVYFAEKRDALNCIEHSGDQVSGSDAAGDVDNEKISFKLSQINKNVHVLFFCATIFSSYTVSFKDVKQCAVRLVDVQDGNKELVRFDKQDISQGNALVIAMLFRKGDDWCFKAIDECFPIQAHGTYRALEPMLQRFWRQTCEVMPDP